MHELVPDFRKNDLTLSAPVLNTSYLNILVTLFLGYCGIIKTSAENRPEYITAHP